MRPTRKIATLRANGFECHAHLMGRVTVRHAAPFAYGGKPAPLVRDRYEVVLYCPDRKNSASDFSFFPDTQGLPAQLGD